MQGFLSFPDKQSQGVFRKLIYTAGNRNGTVLRTVPFGLCVLCIVLVRRFLLISVSGPDIIADSKSEKESNTSACGHPFFDVSFKVQSGNKGSQADDPQDALLKSFLLPVGHYAGASLPTLLSALSCGAAAPVTGLEILHISDRQADPVLPPMIRDLNRAHTLFDRADNLSFFPSSFSYDSCRPDLPSVTGLSAHSATASLLSALRGKGVPLSYRTDREAVEWAFSAFLTDISPASSGALYEYLDKLRICCSAGDDYRVALLCDLCDPFSAGIAFALLRFFRDRLGIPSSRLSLFSLAVCPGVSGRDSPVLVSSLRALAEQDLTGKPGQESSACAGAVWLLSLPSSLYKNDESLRLLYTVAARQIARFFSAAGAPSAGLHTVTVPGILTFQSLGDQAKAFASFLHAGIWLLCDLIPAFSAYCDHPGSLRSLAPNSRSGLFRRLLLRESVLPDQREIVIEIRRAFSAVLSQVVSLIRYMPDQLRLAEVSDPLWRRAVELCGKTVTVASEYDVSRKEAEESGVMDIKPVHRVSMADTEEEKAARRLEDIAAQLKAETEARDMFFASVGCCWKLPALLDCRRRCLEALNRASDLLDNTGADMARYDKASLDRRVRLLRAAVDRCDRDLADRSRSSADTDAVPEGLTPFSSQLLTAASAEKLFLLLNASEENAEQARRDLLNEMPSLFFGFALSDAKALFRQLLACCKPESDRDPFSSLCLSTLDVSARETSPLRFLSAGDLPGIPLLPDLYPAAPLLTVSAVLPLMHGAADDAERIACRRGLLAMLLLRQYRRRTSEEASLSCDTYHIGDSPVLRAWLSARSSECVRIFSLGTEETVLPFALVLPGRELIPARLSSAHVPLVPVFASPWFDEESLTFRDPCALLGESDRAILLEQLSAMTDPKPQQVSADLLSFLSDFRRDLMAHGESSALPDHLALRLKAAFGLRLLPAFRDTLVRTPCFYERFLDDDAVSAVLMDRPEFRPSACSVSDDIVYLYRNVPFARENSRTLLEAIPLPAENWILSLLDKESRTLSRSSDDYHDHLVRELSLLLERCPDALPEARRVAFDLLEKAGQPVPDADTELIWPWDPSSPSVSTILTEALGEGLASSAIQPFSDLLALFPARGTGIIGDSLLSSMCQLPPAVVRETTDEETAVPPDAVLPPLSPSFCAALCRLPEGKTLVRPGMLSLERAEKNSVRVTVTLEGSFIIRLVRIYAEEEIVPLYAHDIPTLAVWPNLPFNPEDWHAYFIYASLPSGFGLSFCGADGKTVCPSEASRLVSRTPSFPVAFSLYRGDRCVGSLPNLLPRPDIVKQDIVTACVDFGSVGTSVVFSVGHHRRPLNGPTLVRTLINNPSLSCDLLRKEFMPAVPVSALLPTASRIFRNVPGEAPLPFEDGIVLMSSDLQDVLSIPSEALYTCLKWEEEKGRSISLCLHQIMLMTALQARSDGAAMLLWRFSVPDEMAKTGRENLIALFSGLADQVCEESGFHMPDKQPLVTFAAESSALGAYFRYCASEDTRGGFMVMDIGACTADISLFLRGREQAVRTCQIPLGVHYMLLPALLGDPGLLRQELGFIQDPSIRLDLLLMEQTLRSAVADPSALRHSRLALDSFIADHYAFVLPGLLQNPSTGMPSMLGSVLLLHFSFLMMLSGLILQQIAADPGKNDFLPEQMTLCISGRGALLPECLPDPYKTALWHFLTMFRNRRVASLSFLFSSEKKMEIPVGLSMLEDVSPGLPAASVVPAAISVRPEELLPQFILRFAKEFPASAEVLFHGFFTGDFYHPFSPRGESLITEAMAQCFTPRTEHRPYDALAGWIGSLLELIRTTP